MAVQAVYNSVSGTSRASRTTSVFDKNDFLQILAKQIKSQNPSNPVQAHQFVSQLSQAAQAEQLQNMTKSISDMRGIAEKGTISQWVSAMGKKMNVEDSMLSQGDEVYLKPTGDYDYITLVLKNQADGSVKEVKFNKGEALVYRNQGEETFVAAAIGVKDNKPVECKLDLYRVVRGIQMSDGGPVMVAGDGKTYAASSVKRLKD
ncbi:MAG: flagellar basal body rod modification protein [Syntrophorhabdaceae bacterium PtaU1.Bin034]|jgi:flagellar hook assembly protein FlgD|nr:MAG: flagellar basal body rod modification protein [Syntrophorhabdaceae bacterium PtaU1.Bin034]